jgi:hypothetical protein
MIPKLFILLLLITIATNTFAQSSSPKENMLKQNTTSKQVSTFIIEGKADVIPNLNKIDDLVSEKRCDCLHLTRKTIVKGGQHNEKLWRDSFVKAYLWLF